MKKKKGAAIAFKTSQIGKNAFRINFELTANKDWEAWLLLQSDPHFDSPKCERIMLKRHLDEAKEKGAAVHINGDLFDAMGGKYDKRSSKSDLRPEYKRDTYLDEIVEDAARFLAPYAHNIVTIAEGNHETAIKNRLEIDLIQRLIGILNKETGSKIQFGHYAGWLKLCFLTGKYKNGTSRHNTSVLLHYDHGYGGGGEVTSDTIQHQRRSARFPDADIIVSGHTHDHWTKDIARNRFSDNGNPYNDVQTHIKIPSYKNDYGTGSGGWCIEKGHAPKVLGAYWIRFYFVREFKRVVWEVIKAQ